MARLIAIDPGTRLAGYAVFDTVPRFDPHTGKTPTLRKARAAGVIKSARKAALADRAAQIAGQLAGEWAFVDFVVVERPVIYPGSRERDSDIMDLAIAAGIIGGALCSAFAARLIMYEPRAWKGTTPKHIHNARTAAACPEAGPLIDVLPKSMRNHAWDAVGLALYQIGKG